MLRRFQGGRLFFDGMAAMLLAHGASCATSLRAAENSPALTLNKGDHICVIGNTLAERMQHFGNWETLLHSRFPKHQLVVRNLAYSADELALRPRSEGFGELDQHLTMEKADVVLAFFGFNESFAGPAGLEKFKADLDKFISETLTKNYSGKSPPRLVMVSPIAAEDLHDPNKPSGPQLNENLKLYTVAIKAAAEKNRVGFADLFTPMQALLARPENLTINGVHLIEEGDKQLAPILDKALFGVAGAPSKIDEKLRAEVNEKNFQYFHRYRAVNGCYIYGGRAKLKFADGDQTNGDVLGRERQILEVMCANRDRRIWTVAQSKSVPARIDDSNVPPFLPVKSNFSAGANPNQESAINYLDPDEAVKKFKLAKGYAINLFASEKQWPELANPVQMCFDAQGRLWATTMPSYPGYKPGQKPNDKVLVLEDANGDGKADKMTVFADGLHVPTGIELGDGGVYVAQQPDLMFLKDTDGDGKADYRQRILHGFDTADSHHALHAFTWDPGGALYWGEGTFHHSQIETPWGPTRLKNAGFFRYEPKTEKLDAFISYPFANPWGITFDDWGQCFVADASGGANYYGTAISGYLDYPEKHDGMRQFLRMRVRPTAGCDLVSSHHFPSEAQGNFLLNNCIGFLGVLQHTVTEEGAGFKGAEIEPLVQSTDGHFRPTDLEFGPDGALYIVDWHNALIGHMQHSIRDPNRDTTHGRIWRVTYPSRPLSKLPKIVGEPIEKLLDLLKDPILRTRHHVRMELRMRPRDKVLNAIEGWITRLDQSDPRYEHHLLEALWLHQQHNVVSQDLLKRLLRSPEPRARAAATRVLCHWRDRVPEALALLKVQANDEHPRVRLEAVRACSFFKTREAIEVALESLSKPPDDYLQYVLDETMRALDKYK